MQVELVKTGKPYVMFGDGQLASCKPISEADLASFMADCVKDPVNANQVLPIGGVRQASYDSKHARAHELLVMSSGIIRCLSAVQGLLWLAMRPV